MSVFNIIELLLTSGSLVTLIIFLVQRHDTKKDTYKKLHEELENIQAESTKKDEHLEKELKKLEKDSVRTQLLLLMNHYHSDDEHELMEVAQHYFVDLEANWILTPRFNRFLEKNKIARPEWLPKQN